ncbi:carbohydrate ABC transporter permease [Homoserinibacter sp. YIM 151385]|uniref:carbohydrate ABC transporter permease n=1 Tax=Homoserinibacter sp. YIM 151385 TaxID=2985506 RepID=UPI0022EFE22C|nr:sugar ABC transporter permease [Homoserinibacter sp. YIM 151385]WBU37448.1 sugar ABC transporter permease [Homoserinibacter sp. YIM 151385]
MTTATGAPSAFALGAPTSRPRRRPRALIAPYLFLAPFFVSFLAFFAIPSVVSLGLSLFRYRGYGELRFIGLDNYSALFSSPTFWQQVQNTLFYWLVPLVPMMGLAFLLALMVRSRLAALGRIYKPLLFIPQIMAPVAAAIVWRVILSREGVVNDIFGLEVGWLSDPATARWSVAALLVWRSLGWYFVIFLAALTSISDDVLEAAEVDGAGPAARVRYMIIPLMRPIFLFAIVIDTIGSIQLFAEPNLLLGTGASAVAPPTGAPIMNQVVSNVSGGQFGLASAAGWIIFAAIGAISIIQFRVLRSGDRS